MHSWSSPSAKAYSARFLCSPQRSLRLLDGAATGTAVPVGKQFDEGAQDRRSKRGKRIDRNLGVFERAFDIVVDSEEALILTAGNDPPKDRDGIEEAIDGVGRNHLAFDVDPGR